MSEEITAVDEEHRRLNEIHAGIEKEIRENTPDSDYTSTPTRSGAVPRTLSAYGERSPGDTSPDAPEGTPTREEGLFQQSRGEGLPMTRGGGPPAPPLGTAEEKKRYWEQKEARLRAQASVEDKRRQDRDKVRAERKSFKVANSPVKVQDFAKFITDEQRRLQLMSGRLESFVIAISIVSSQVPDDSPIREFCERFKAAIPEANDLWARWRDTVNSITESEMNFSDMRKVVTEWNEDKVKPRIGRHCFNPHWALWKFGLKNPDATLTLEEKKEFAIDLGYTEPEVNAMTAGFFPKPGEEDTEEDRAEETEK